MPVSTSTRSSMMKMISLPSNKNNSKIGTLPALNKSVLTEPVPSCEVVGAREIPKGARTKSLLEHMGEKEKSLLERLGMPLKRMRSDCSTDYGECTVMRMTSNKVGPNECGATRTSTRIMCGARVPLEGKHHGCLRLTSLMLQAPVSSEPSTTLMSRMQSADATPKV